MSEHRNAIARVAASLTRRRRRWMTGVVAVLGASGLALGGVGVPVSANDLNTTGNVHASADVQGDCVTAAAGTGQAEESVNPQQDSELQATGQGTATVSVCRDGMGGTPPGDPGDPGTGNLDEVVPDDPAGELNDVVTDALEDEVPHDGDGFPPGDPGGEIPGAGDVVPGQVVPDDPGGAMPGGGDSGGPGDVVPGEVGGLVPDGHGLVPNLLDRLAQINPPAVGGGDSDGDDGDGPAKNPSPSGTASGSVDVGGASPDANAEDGSLTGSVLGGELKQGEPGLVDAVVAPGGSLPRTGGGLGSGVLRLIAFLGLGRALFGLAIRRYSSAGHA
jgi:hypothetical protein